MAEQPEPIGQMRATAQVRRLQAIQSQLAVGFTLCALAKTEILYRRFDDARKLIEKLLHSAQTIHRHLDEPNHVPGSSVADLREQLAQLTKRIQNVDEQLRSRSAGVEPLTAEISMKHKL